jgi:hypothetical protein
MKPTGGMRELAGPGPIHPRRQTDEQEVGATLDLKGSNGRRSTSKMPVIRMTTDSLHKSGRPFDPVRPVAPQMRQTTDEVAAVFTADWRQGLIPRRTSRKTGYVIRASDS